MKILVCTSSYPAAVDRLNTLLPDHEILSCSSDQVLEKLDGVDVVIPTMASIDQAVIASGKFGLIHQLGVGLDSVDIDAATAAGVWVARVPGAGSGNAESVAEHTILLILALLRKLPEAQENVRRGVFAKPTGMALFGKSVCIVGMGDIGYALAKRLRAFEVHVTAVREHPDTPIDADLGVDRVFGHNDLNEAISAVDLVILAIPATKQNYNLFDQSALNSMKTGAYLINVARGSILDYEALTRALESGHIAGAGLDVFWDEPVDATHPLFKQNVIATPHVAGNTDASLDGVTTVLAENIKRFAEGKKPIHTINNPKNCRSIPASV